MFDDKEKLKKAGKIFAGVIGFIASVITIYTFVGKDHSKPETKNIDPHLYFAEYEAYFEVTRYDGTSKTVSIPDYKDEKPVLVIGEGAFKGNTTVKEVWLPEKLEIINSKAFSECSSLTTVYFPDSLKSIEESAFKGCTKLSEISLPAGLEVLNSRAFSDCNSLTEIVIPGSVEIIDQFCFYRCGALESMTIEEGCGFINPMAFNSCPKLRYVSIPDSMQEIDNWAFYNCLQLTSVSVPRNCNVKDAFEENTIVSRKGK